MGRQVSVVRRRILKRDRVRAAVSRKTSKSKQALSAQETCTVCTRLV